MADDYDNRINQLREEIRTRRETEEEIRVERQTLEQELRTLLARRLLYPHP